MPEQSGLLAWLALLLLVVKVDTAEPCSSGEAWSERDNGCVASRWGKFVSCNKKTLCWKNTWVRTHCVDTCSTALMDEKLGWGLASTEKKVFAKNEDEMMIKLVGFSKKADVVHLRGANHTLGFCIGKILEFFNKSKDGELRDSIAQDYSRSAKIWCAEQTPRTIKQQLLPKHPPPNEGGDWLRTQTLAGYAMIGKLALDPYPPPTGHVTNTSHLQTLCIECLATEDQKNWPASLKTLRGQQLFTDDYLVQSSDKVVRVMGEPEIVRSNILEITGGMSKYFSVVFNGEEFLLYHSAGRTAVDGMQSEKLPMLKDPPESDRCGISIARSKDGAWWEYLPEEKYSSFCKTRDGGGYNAVNLEGYGVSADGEFCVTYHSRDDKRWRYKMGYQCGVNQICVAYSADGLSFRAYNTPVFSRAADTYNCLVHVEGSMYTLNGSMYTGSMYTLFSRAEIGTDTAWREIRGVNVASGKLDFEKDLRLYGKPGSSPAPTPAATWSPEDKARNELEGIADDVRPQDGERDWIGAKAPSISYPLQLVQQIYLDAQGKLERYRRQVYSFVVDRSDDDIFTGIMQLVEFPKEGTRGKRG
jgi:hypothetical protein